MRVEIRTIKGGKDDLAGVLSLEDGKIVAEPDIPLLQNILAEPVYSWKDRRGYDAAGDPEGFLRALHQQYRSAYLRASKPQESKKGEPTQYAKEAKGETDDHRHLADFYAALWNLVHPDADEMTHADDELQEGVWVVNCRPDGRWEVLHVDDLPEPEEGEQYSRQQLQYAAEHAPRGGVTINGKFYRGGQWIPARAMAEATPEERAEVEEGKRKRTEARAARGNVDVDALRTRLAADARKLGPKGMKQAQRSFNALHKFHGHLTLHRIEELERQTREMLKKPWAQGNNLELQLKQRLAQFDAMIDMATARGVTGNAIMKAEGKDNGEHVGEHGGAGEGGGLPTGQPVGERSAADAGQGAAGSAGGTPGGERPGELPASADGGRDEPGGPAAGAGDAAGSGTGAGAEPTTGSGESGADGGMGSGGGAGGHGGGSAASLSAAVLSQPATPETPTDLSAGNFRYDPDQDWSFGGAKTKFRNNIEAIKALKGIQAEGRDTATPAEQEALSKYVGWGQFPQLFQYYGSGAEKWNKERDELRGLLSEEEWEAARKSTMNAHYTHPDVVKAHWQMAQKLGYKGGRFLETSAGIGYYLGLMPPEMSAKTHSSAVELDQTTGKMLQLLYPKTNARVQGFEQFATPDNFYDLVASNVPFGDYKVHDPRYNKHQANIHDYFFLKSLDVAKPGGLVMHITSNGTLDKSDDSIRKLLADKAELVSAIRFPGGAHKENAGTEVVTDMLILRKKDPNVPPVTDETPEEAAPKEVGFSGITTDKLGRLYHWKDGKRVAAPNWLETTTVPDPAGGEPIPVNKYFADNPHQVLGTIDRTGSMYHGESMNVSKPEDYEQRLQAAVDRLPANIMQQHKAPAERFSPASMPAPGDVRPGGYKVQDGKLYAEESGQLVEQQIAAKDLPRVEGQLGLRDTVRALLNTQLQGGDATELRKQLNEQYDAFVKKHGFLHDPKNAKLLRTDPDSPVLLAMEHYDPKTKKATKADIFTKDTVRSAKPVEKAGSVHEALGVSLHDAGSIDIGRMAKLTGQSEEAIGRELETKGLAYHDPNEGWKPADQYLSGNVRKKLLMAKAAAAADPRYQRHVEALEKVQPEDVSHDQIRVKLGASWVPPSDIKNFAAHLLNGSADDFAINYIPATGEWQADFSKGGKWLASRQLAREVWGTPAKKFDALFEAALNNKNVTVYDEDSEGHKFVDQKATDDANAKIQDMKDRFKDWVWEDDERRDRLHRYYNDNFNNIRDLQYDGQHLTFPGMNPAVNLRPHIKDFVWQVISTGKGLAAHEVGMGKTNTMIASAMELRRLGLAKKPCIAVKKANIEDIVSAAQHLYPGAKILSTADIWDAKSRKKTISQIATGDYDMIIMTHDNLDMIQMKPETTETYIHDEMKELEAAKTAAEGRKDKNVVKSLEKAKARLEARLKDATDASKKDDAVFFEDLGIDQLIVDEAHRYKSLPVYTGQQQVKGIPTTRSDRATNMQMRSRWLMANNGGRGLVFMSGTPVNNSMAEMYTLQRYLQPEELKERGVDAFDSWASTFGDITTENEFTATGEYKPVSRFREFTNVSELMGIGRQMMDVRFADDAKDDKGNKIIVRPKRKDSAVVSPPSEAMKGFMDGLIARAEKIKGQRVEKGGDNMLKICTDGRKGAVDLRLVDANAEDDPSSKTNQCVNKVLEMSKARPGVTQLIFSDVGVNPMENGFHLYGDIIDKLVAGGIPREKIADFSKLEGPKKEAAQAAMRRGDIVVGIGSTEKLGTGVNVQDKLAALHHLDVPFTPAQVEQRDGRGFRSGNMNDPSKPAHEQEVGIHRYVAEGSLDTFMWQLVSNKSNFIKQALTPPNKGGSTQRHAREEDTEQLSFEQLKAVASGDPRVLEKVNLAGDVKQLRSAKDRHAREQAKLQQSVKATEAQIPHLERELEGRRKDEKTLTDNPDFSLTIGDKTYADRKEAAEAFGKALEEGAGYSKYSPQQIGTYRGMDIYRQGDKFYLQGEGGEYKTGPSLASVEAIARTQGNRVKDTENEIAARRSDLEKTRKEIGKTFAKGDELTEKEKRLKDLEAELSAKAETATEPKPKEERHLGTQIEDALKDKASSLRAKENGAAVSVAALRRANPGLSRQEFDSAVMDLWRQGKIDIEGFSDWDKMPKEDIEGAIPDKSGSGAPFTYIYPKNKPEEDATRPFAGERGPSPQESKQSSPKDIAAELHRKYLESGDKKAANQAFGDAVKKHALNADEAKQVQEEFFHLLKGGEKESTHYSRAVSPIGFTAGILERARQRQ